MTDVQTHILNTSSFNKTFCSLGSVSTQFVCVFNLVMLPILSFFNFSVQGAFPPKDIWMFLSVLGLIDFLSLLVPKILVFNIFLCIVLITRPISCLICQTIHLKYIFPQQHHLLKLWTMILFYLRVKLVAVIQCPLRRQIQTLFALKIFANRWWEIQLICSLYI